jgi:hypothetical protein
MGGIPTPSAVNALAERLVREHLDGKPDQRPVTAEDVRKAIAEPKWCAVESGGCAPPVWVAE